MITTQTVRAEKALTAIKKMEVIKMVKCPYSRQDIAEMLNGVLDSEYHVTQFGVKPHLIKRLNHIPRAFDRLGMSMKILATHDDAFSNERHFLIELTRKNRIELTALAELIHSILEKGISWYELEFTYNVFSEDENDTFFSEDDAEDFARRQRHGGTVFTYWHDFCIDEQDFDGTDYEEPIDYWRETEHLWHSI